MSKFLLTANYSSDGAKGLLADGGTKRLAAARAAIETIGGTLESFHYAVGFTDVYAICDFPDDVSAVAMSMMVNSTGMVTGSLTKLLSVEQVDEAAAKARSGSYSPPGT